MRPLDARSAPVERAAMPPNPPSDTPAAPPLARSAQKWLVPAVVAAAVTLVIVTVLAAPSILVLFTDGTLASLVIVAGLGLGAGPARALLGPAVPRSQLFALSAALGLGGLGLLTLALGAAGLLNRPVAGALLVAGLALAALRALEAWRTPSGKSGTVTAATGSAGNPADPAPACGTARVLRAALLALLAVPLGLGLVGASIPPGILWDEENGGYDVLEYHLQGPREYFDSGRIHFLPHNVYTSFPQQVEMLYLLLMHLAGDPWAAAIPAQYLHLFCGVLAVLALAAFATPPASGAPPTPWASAAVAALAGTVPWLAYLSALAYVELGLLLFAAVAGGLLLAAVRDPRRATARTLLAVGLCAGLAGGCKYTALVFVTAALGIAWLLAAPLPWRRRIRGAVVYGAGALAAFGPWLVRNAAFTGNPVYPFAYRVFGGAAWSAEQDEQWARGHRLPPGRDMLADRLAGLWNEWLTERRLGPAVIAAAAVGLVLARGRAAALLAVWLGVAVGAWVLLTHMPGRFAVPTVVPLVLLAGLGLAAARPPPVRYAFLGLLVVAAGWNNVTAVRDWLRQDAAWRARGVPLRELPGTTSLLRGLEAVNHVVPADGRVKLIGEARAYYIDRRVDYTVVFNRDPWLAEAAGLAPAQALARLRTAGVTHLVFSWPEIERLRRTYGFPTHVTRDWVADLRAAGLRPVPVPTELDRPGVEVYEVPRE